MNFDSEKLTALTETVHRNLETYRRAVAPECDIDVQSFAVFFPQVLVTTIELDLDEYTRKQGKKREAIKKRLKRAKSEKTKTKVLKELADICDAGDGRQIDEAAEEAMYRLMAFKFVMTKKLPGRAIESEYGVPYGNFHYLADRVFKLFEIKRQPDKILERLMDKKGSARRAKTLSEVEKRANEFADFMELKTAA